MTKDETIDRLWENSNHGTRREDVEEAYNAGAAAEREECALWYSETGWLLDEESVADAMRKRDSFVPMDKNEALARGIAT